MVKVSNVEIPVPTPYDFIWTPKRIAAVLAGIRESQISFNEASTLFRLNETELRTWQRVYEIQGIEGLRSVWETNDRAFEDDQTV